MVEVWKDIIIEKNGVLYDFTGKYQVSNLGRVRSLNYKHTGEIRVLKPGKRKDRYLHVRLYVDGKQKMFYIHRLVATAFIPNPDNLPVVNHKDENPSNCCVDNLEWCTQEYNANYGTRNERVKEKKSKKVICIETGQVFESENEAERHIGCGGIGHCCKGKQKTCGGYHWAYVD